MTTIEIKNNLNGAYNKFIEILADMCDECIKKEKSLSQDSKNTLLAATDKYLQSVISIVAFSNGILSEEENQFIINFPVFGSIFNDYNPNSIEGLHLLNQRINSNVNEAPLFLKTSVKFDLIFQTRYSNSLYNLMAFFVLKFCEFDVSKNSFETAYKIFGLLEAYAKACSIEIRLSDSIFRK